MIPQLLFSLLTLVLLTHLLSTLLSPHHPSPFFPRHPSLPNKLLSPDPRKPKLRLNSKGTFKIAIFSDLHYGEDEDTFGAEQDQKSTGVIGKILELEGGNARLREDGEGVDFVVFDGDFITGENTHKENSTQYIHQIVSPVVSQNISWASVYGNHDTQFNLSREKLFAEETKYDLSYTQHGPKGVGGVTNYWLPVYPHLDESSDLSDDEEYGMTRYGKGKKKEKEETPVMILYFFDSQGGENYQVPRWNFWGGRTMPNWVTTTAVSNFISQRTLIESHFGILPSLAFVHIPPTSFLDFQKTKVPGKGDKDMHYPGLNDDVPVANQGEGRWGKTKDRKFMRALRGTRGLVGVFSGHDHGNSWCANWPDDAHSSSRIEIEDEGPEHSELRGFDEASGEDGEDAWADRMGKPKICFVKHTGYGGYGNWRRGSRVLGLTFADPPSHTREKNGGGKKKKGNQGMDVESWVRLEEGDVVQRVSLNETYGVDVYPSEDGEEGRGR